MVVLPDQGSPEAVLTVVIVVSISYVDLELGVRNEELHVEIQACNPVIVVEVVG